MEFIDNVYDPDASGRPNVTRIVVWQQPYEVNGKIMATDGQNVYTGSPKHN